MLPGDSTKAPEPAEAVMVMVDWRTGGLGMQSAGGHRMSSREPVTQLRVEGESVATCKSGLYF